MIGKLKGIIEEIQEDHCILDVNGVGYLVYCSSRTLASFSGVGTNQILYIETYVREDAIRLFGFHLSLEQNWFRLLIHHVQGIGARLALSVLSILSCDELSYAVSMGDVAMLSRVPGVGKKVAERMITELRDKTFPVSLEISQASLSQNLGGHSFVDAISVLTNLGYAREIAAHAVAIASKKVGKEEDSSVLIKLALQELSS